jgi:tripeptide aminopeptidase
MQSVVDRFIRYIQIDTQSDPHGDSSPSTAKQLDLARLLVKELNQLGLKNVTLNSHGIVTATLPSNTHDSIPTIGFMAHMDTSPAFSGKHVHPQITESYDGGDIRLGGISGLVLSPVQFPELRGLIGQTLITTDGMSLLGADDKAGIAEVMTAMETLVNHPEILHGTLKVAFTPDEEIGTGAGLFDTKAFNADFAYTLDGGLVGEINYENFNAAGAKIDIQGRSVHPGTAKNTMINALQMAIELHNCLPAAERPENTEGYQGFFHLDEMQGDVEKAHLEYIIRDHDRQRFEARKTLMQDTAAVINQTYGPGTVRLELHDSYYNMKDQLQPVMHIVETAAEAMHLLDIEPKIRPIRGGTDGAQFSYKGLPCPNLFTGGGNAHGPYEYASVQQMEQAVQVVLKIIDLYTHRLD